MRQLLIRPASERMGKPFGGRQQHMHSHFIFPLPHKSRFSRITKLPFRVSDMMEFVSRGKTLKRGSAGLGFSSEDCCHCGERATGGRRAHLRNCLCVFQVSELHILAAVTNYHAICEQLLKERASLIWAGRGD